MRENLRAVREHLKEGENLFPNPLHKLTKELFSEKGARPSFDAEYKWAEELGKIATQLEDAVVDLAHPPKKANSEITKATLDDHPTLDGFRSADALYQDHGISKQRLSEAKADGRVRSQNAPHGYKDSEGRSVRILYHEGDAKKHCIPKHLRKPPRQKKPFAGL